MLHEENLPNVHSYTKAQSQPRIIKPSPIRLHSPNTILSQLRLDQTPCAPNFWRHQLHLCFSHGGEPARSHSPIPYPRNRFLSSQHRPPPDNSYTSLSSSVPAFSQQSQAYPTLLTFSSCSPSPQLHPVECYAHSPTLAVPAFFRSCPLDRASV